MMSNQKDFEVAKGIFSGKGLQVEEQNKSIVCHTLAELARQMLEKLETSNIRVESLSLHKPTLDDVFMQLTNLKLAKLKEEQLTEQAVIKPESRSALAWYSRFSSADQT